MGDIFSKVCSDMSDDEDDNEDKSMEDANHLESEASSGDSDDSEDDPMEDVKPILIKTEVSSGESDTEDDEIHFLRRSPINIHIRKMATKIPYRHSGQVKCYQCGRKVKFYTGEKRKINCKVLVSHAASHLKKPLYECQFCHITMRKCSIQAHMKKTHAAERAQLPANASGYKMIDGMEYEVMEMLSKCFDKRRGGGRGKESEDKAIYQIESHAKRIATCDASVQSLQCVNGIKKEIDDFTNDHHREIMENLTKCYDWS